MITYVCVSGGNKCYFCGKFYVHIKRRIPNNNRQKIVERFVQLLLWVFIQISSCASVSEGELVYTLFNNCWGFISKGCWLTFVSLKLSNLCLQIQHPLLLRTWFMLLVFFLNTYLTYKEKSSYLLQNRKNPDAATTKKASIKKLFLKISQYSRKNTFVGVSFW